jgi:hypothetical protein
MPAWDSLVPGENCLEELEHCTVNLSADLLQVSWQAATILYNSGRLSTPLTVLKNAKNSIT